MHARVAIGQVKPAKMDEYISIMRDSVAPAAIEQGSRGTLLLTDPNAGRAIAISLWDTEEEMMAGTTSADLREQVNRALSLFVALPGFEFYEVSVRT